MAQRGAGFWIGAAAPKVVVLAACLACGAAALEARERDRGHRPRFTRSTGTYLEVSANVMPRCQLETVPVVFPQYTGAASQATGAVRVTCSTRCDTFAIAFDAGDHYPGGKDRRMSDGAGHYLRYVLRTSSGRLWGDRGYGNTYTQGDPVHGSAPGSHVPAVFPVKGTLAAGQRVPAGAYLDAVWVTLDF